MLALDRVTNLTDFVFAGQSMKKRTYFCPKISERTFNVGDPPETPLVSDSAGHKNVTNRSPEEDNVLPGSKRFLHSGLAAEIDALSLVEIGRKTVRDPLEEVFVAPSQVSDEKSASAILVTPPFSAQVFPMEHQYGSPVTDSDKASPQVAHEFLTPSSPPFSTNIKFSSARERSGTITEFLKEKGHDTPESNDCSKREQVMNTLTPVTSVARRILSSEEPFSSGYVSGTNSETGSEFGLESPVFEEVPDGNFNKLDGNSNCPRLFQGRKLVDHSRPRCLTISFENDSEKENTFQEGYSKSAKHGGMDINSPLMADSSMDVTFKSQASSKGTPGVMELSPAPIMRTSFQSPKSCRRGNHSHVSPPRNRILGTPDYLAPEILLGHEHSKCLKSYVQTDATSLLALQCWELLRPCWQWCTNGCNSFQQCWNLQCIVRRI